jgi:phosphate transport system substrate-binding protein
VNRPVKSGLLLLLFSLLAAAGPACAETVRIAGSGGMIPLLTELANAYMKKNPADLVEVSSLSITQSGGILAAKKGEVDIGMSARNLTNGEKDGSIEAFHVADVAAEVAVHGNVPVKGLTSRQLCAIYGGKIRNWKEVGGPNAQIILLTRPDSDSTKQAFREGIACFRELKEDPNAIPMIKSRDMYNALTSIPNSIGLIDSVVLEQARGKARSVKIDGKASSPEAISAGRWPVVKHYNLVLGGKRTRAVHNFMKFIKSPEGGAIIRKHRGVPVSFDFK